MTIREPQSPVTGQPEMTFTYVDCPLTFTMADALAREAAGEWVVIGFVCATGRGYLTARFGERTCDIHSFDCEGEQRKGNGRKTLQALRSYFDYIDVPNPVAWRFWRQMRFEGLVRDMFDMDTSYEDSESTGIVFEDLDRDRNDTNPF